MENRKMIVIINNEKQFILKNKLNLEEINAYIKKVFHQQNQTIDLYDKNYSKINTLTDLEKLKEYNPKYNVDIIKINFKVRNSNQKQNKKENYTLESKNSINSYESQKSKASIGSKKSINLFESQNSLTSSGNKKMRGSNMGKKNNEIKKKKIDLNKTNSDKNINISINKLSSLKNSFEKEISNFNIEMEEEKFNEEIQKYKNKQKDEIKALENELNELKKIKDDLENKNDNNIILNNDIIDNLKQVIINEIDKNIEKEFSKKIEKINTICEQNIFNIFGKYINEQVETIKKDIIKENKKLPIKENHQNINELNNNFNNNTNNNININNKINNEINNNINGEKNKMKEKQNKITHNTFTRKKNQTQINSININLLDKNEESSNNIDYNNNLEKFININSKDNNKKINNNQGKKPEDIIEDEDVNQNCSNNNIIIKDSNKYNRHYQNLDYRNSKNERNKDNNLFGGLNKEKPKPLLDNKNLGQVEKPNYQKKISKDFNLFPLFNSIFFKNQQQNIINVEKISEQKKEKLKNYYFKDLKEKRNIVPMYATSFIESNVLKIFKQPNISKDVLDIVKYNISSVLQSINMNPEHYSAYYYPNIRAEKRVNRRSSVEAAKAFRKEFNIKNEDLNEEVLIETLNQNDNDLYKTFGLIYGK